MKRSYILLCVFFLFLNTKAFANQEKVEDYKAVFYINQYKTVCGTLFELKSRERMTYLNLGGKYPKHKIALVIWKEQLSEIKSKFGSLERIINQRICAKGKIKEYKENVQLSIKDSQSIWIDK